MKLAIARSGIVLALVALLQACGGGGSGGGNGSGPDTSPRLTISATNISVSATPGQNGPAQIVTLTITNPPDAGLYLEAGYSDSGIVALDFSQTSNTTGDLSIAFRSPNTLQNATYTDTISVRVCTSDPCTSQIRGSPATITTAYVVSGDGVATASLDHNAIQFAADTRDQSQHLETARVTLSAEPANWISVQSSQTSNAIQTVFVRQTSGTVTEVEIYFHPGAYLGSGTFNDTVTLTLCYDSSCARQVKGSPFTITTSVSVQAGAEPGVPPLDVESRISLTHDVVDAEFSKALNQIVMVSSYPVNALYVYDVATSTESRQLLNKVPTSVSIAPDGLTAAVGHDALITVVDLATVGQPGAPAPILLNVSADVFDLVLDGRGSVHAFPRVDQWVQPHSIDIATNTEQLGGYPLRAGSHARLHPSADFIYTADNGLSPSDIQKWDITSGVALLLYDSPYHGDYGMCGDLWFEETGATIYTACGNTFRSSTDRAQDMLYSGALELSQSVYYGFKIRSLSQSAAQNEIALIEYETYQCEIVPGSAGPCYTHLAFYESDFLNRLAVYSVGPVSVNGLSYVQYGLFVFHDAISSKKYLIGKLEGMPNPDAEYYLSVVP